MKSFRTFVAIPLENDLRRRLGEAIDRLAQDGDGVKWVPKDQLHLTLKFLGDVENVELARVCEAAQTVCDSHEPFSVDSTGLMPFPTAHRPRMVAANIVDDSGALVRLVNGLEDAYADLGFKREPRDYRPHLTLGRCRGGSRRLSPAVVERIEPWSSSDFGELGIDRVELISSVLDNAGPTYHVIDTIVLGEDT